MEQLIVGAMDNLFSLALALGGIAWFMKRDSKREEQIDALNKELRQSLEDNLTKTYDVIDNNSQGMKAMTQSFESLKGVITRNG